MIVGRAFILGAVAFAVGACSLASYERHSAFDFVELYPGSEHRYQLRIPYRVESRGNPHELFSYEKREYTWADWVFIESADGAVGVNGKLFSCPERPGQQSFDPVRGRLVFSPNSVEVDLEVPPRPLTEGALWRPYELNGRYRLLRPQTPPSEPRCL